MGAIPLSHTTNICVVCGPVRANVCCYPPGVTERPDGDPLGARRPPLPSTPDSHAAPPPAGVRRLGWGIAAVGAVAVVSLLLQLVPTASRAWRSTDAPSRSELAVCARLSRDVNEDLVAVLGTGGVFDSLGWVDSEEHRRRAVRALERADETLVEVWRCYENLPGEEAGEAAIQHARLVLADWLLLYEDAGIRESVPGWYDMAVAVRLLGS